jgi:hypothetical protein
MSQQRLVSCTEYKAISWKFSQCMNVLRALNFSTGDGNHQPNQRFGGNPTITAVILRR